MTYKINFTQGGNIVQQWDGYATRADALAAIRDADMIIPFTWSYDIVTA